MASIESNIGHKEEEGILNQIVGSRKGRGRAFSRLVWTLAGFSIVLGVGLWVGGQIGAGVKSLTSLS